MTHVDTPQVPQPGVSPTLLMGAASPLWGYFAATAASGVAFWWMTRWTRPVNLEAFFAAAKPQTAPVPEPVTEVLQVVAHEPEVEVAAAPDLAMIQDDVALMDVSPVMEVPPEPELEPAVEAAAEPLADLVPEPAVEELPSPVLKVRGRKGASGASETEA